MNLLLYKAQEELLFRDLLFNKIRFVYGKKDHECQQIHNNILFIFTFYNKPNDFSSIPHYDVKNPNYDHWLLVDASKEKQHKMISWFKTTIDEFNARYQKVLDSFYVDPGSLDTALMSKKLLELLSERQLFFFDNPLVQQLLAQNQHELDILLDFARHALFYNENIMSLSHDIIKDICQNLHVRYQAFGNPFLSGLTLLDYKTAPAIRSDLECSHINFFEDNLNNYDLGYWLVYMPHTEKEFKKILNKIESHCRNNQDSGFFLIFPDWERLVIKSPFLKTKIKTHHLRWAVFDPQKEAVKKNTFCVCFLSFKITMPLDIFS